MIVTKQSNRGTSEIEFIGRLYTIVEQRYNWYDQSLQNKPV